MIRHPFDAVRQIIHIGISGGAFLGASDLSGKGIHSGYGIGQCLRCNDNLFIEHVIIGKIDLFASRDTVVIRCIRSKTVPKTIDSTRFELEVFLIPVDFLKRHRITELIKYRFGQLRIKIR